MANSIEVPQKVKNRAPIRSGTQLGTSLQKTSGYLSEEKKLIQKDICTLMFIVALFTKGRISKPPKCPLIDERIKKKWNTHTYTQ